MARFNSILKLFLIALPLTAIMCTQAWAQFDDSDDYNDQGSYYDNNTENYVQPYGSEKYRPPSPGTNSANATSSENEFANPEDPIHFKTVDGDFWFKGKCRACDRFGVKDTNTIAQKSKLHPPKSHPKNGNSSQRVQNS